MSVVEAAIRAIAERHRREIVRLTRDGELTAGQIAAHFEVSRPAVSQHLRILKDTGLLSERRQGTRRFYRARLEGLAELRAFLEVLLGEDTWISLVGQPDEDGRAPSSVSEAPAPVSPIHDLS
jgi:DNA-binding transcriptional ArsR family regulator